MARRLTNTNWMRQRLLSNVAGTIGDKQESFEELRITEWSDRFVELMRNRLLMGRYRYGKMVDNDMGPMVGIDSAIARL